MSSTMKIMQTINPPSTHNKCGLWAVLMGLYLSGSNNIEAVFDAILIWMSEDCGRFLLNQDGTPSNLMFSFPQGTFLNLGEIYIGRQYGSNGLLIEEGDFLKTDEGRTTELFFKVAEAFQVTIQIFEITRINSVGVAEVCSNPRCQIGDGETIIRIGRLFRGAHFYTLVDPGSVDIDAETATQIAGLWVSHYKEYMRTKFEGHYKEPESDEAQIESDHELAMKLSIVH